MVMQRLGASVLLQHVGLHHYTMRVNRSVKQHKQPCNSDGADWQLRARTAGSRRGQHTHFRFIMLDIDFAETEALSNVRTSMLWIRVYSH